MQLYIFVLLLALVVCAVAQWPYYNHYYGASYPYAYSHGYYNPALSYYWK